MSDAAMLHMGDHETEVVEWGGRTAVDAIVLVHALGLDHEMWNGVVGALPSDWRCVAYDLRGNGRAAQAPAGDLKVYAADLRRIFDYAGLERAHLAGISMGGAIAMTFAGANPARLSSLSLICTPAHAVPAFEERAVAAERDGMVAQVEDTLGRWFAPGAADRQDSAVRYARACIQRNPPAAWAACWRALSGFSPSALLSDLPVLLVAGTADRSTPPEHMRRLLPFAPHARFEVVEGGTHMLALESPGPLASILRDAIA